MTDREIINLKAAMYTGIVLVVAICIVILQYCYPMIFPIVLVTTGLFVLLSFVFLVIKRILESEVW